MKFLLFRAFLLCVTGLAPATAATAQAGTAARLRVAVPQEELRSAPGGNRIGLVLRGAALPAGPDRAGWREVTVEGWIPARAVRAEAGPRYNLTATGQATVYAEPGGLPLARTLNGTRLRQLAREGAWVRVQRQGWVRSAATTPATRPPAAAAFVPARGAPPAQPVREAKAAPARQTPPVAPGGTLVLHTAPSGDTLAVLPPTAAVEVVERDGEWTRVRVEGWTRAPVRGAPGGLDLRTLRESPDAHRGREVRWTARFIALRRAEEIRTDFTPGEPYVLARDPNGEAGFVYIAVTPQQALAVKRLLPLQKFAFVARVRTGASSLMGHPVLELVELRP